MKLSGTLQLEKVRIIQLHDAPKLLVEWSPRWEEFLTSIRPALARSGPRLAGEAPHGVFPYRGMLASLLMEFIVLLAVMTLPREIARLRPYAAPHLTPDEVIYYSGDELPRTEDLGGAEAGRSGRAGGQEAHHRTQTIHVARGASLTAKVVDAPALKLPATTGSVANLLAMRSNPGPLPLEGSPAPTKVARDRFRNAVSLDSVVRPAPSISSDSSRATPSLNSAVVPPAPSLRSDHALIAPVLDSSVIAPAPSLSRQRTLVAPALNSSVISPASTRVSRDHARSTPALNSGVIPPAPSTSGREVAPSRVQMNSVAVVPPPVSAPESDTGRNAKLHLPAPSVVAPPPSATDRELRRLESGSAASSATVVPPPPTQSGSPSFVSSIIGKIFGTQDVVPPPPSVSSTSRSAPGAAGGGLAANVVPPPPSASGAVGGGASRMSRTSPGENVVPPPPSVSASGSGSAAGGRLGGAPGSGNDLASNVVPPPPSVGSGSGISGSGRKGSGLGAPGDSGSALAPPKGAGGNSDNSGILISAQPGSNVGMPGVGGKGSIAMSPTGGDKPGLGGSGGGIGIGRGEGSGSGLTGANATENSGAGKTGSGRGSDPTARAGISPTPGPGGAGSAPTGSPAVPGVDVRGGSTVVNLPSFGSDGGGNGQSLPGRSAVKGEQGPAITIVATSRSGGAFDFYGKLPGDNYTVYVDTAMGTVVMQFAEANLAAARTHPGTLVGPEGIRTDIAANLPHVRVVIKCRLDASGNVRNPQVLEAGPAAMTAKIMAALPSWKFRPAMRGAQPVEINAILGFNIDTNDRN